MRRSRALLFDDRTIRLEILRTRICDLGLELRGTPLDRAIRRVHRELRSRKISLRPNFYLSGEYGCVPVTINIGLGFWDCNGHLRALNHEFRNFRNSTADLVNLVRHECGHAFCYSYKLYRTREFRSLFRVRGHFFQTYPSTDRYGYNPWSRDYVNIVGDHYAQKHPDDDFAETFAEFVRGDAWKRKYRTKPGAMKKLQYVRKVARQWGRKEPLVKGDPNNLDEPVERLRRTVGDFLNAGLGRYRKKATGYIDRDLLSIFRRRGRSDGAVSVVDFVRENRQLVVQNASEWAHVSAGVVRDILEKVKVRAKAMDLVVPPGATRKALVEFTSFVTSKATRFAVSRKF
ncbi:MAG: hypothetical protein ACYTAF_01390 [Planctomycetota bacterium]|jgi:hypothetical protein